MTTTPGPATPLEVVHVIATLTPGGAERQLELVAPRSRHHARVVALYGAGGLADALRAQGVEVTELRATGWRKPLTPLVLARRLRRAAPDVVHVHLLSGQLHGIVAARLARVPLIVSTEHSLMDTTIEGRPHRWWLRALYRGLERLTSHTIAVSEVTSRRLQRWGVRRERITVADLGVDLDAVAFDPAARAEVRAELGADDDTRVIGAVGRLEPVKRIDVTLRACAPLLRDGAMLVVAGAGPLLEPLRRLADELGVADRVRWLGSRERIGPLLSAMDALVSASADETFGMAIVEAVGSGLPVVYVACPALELLPEPVEHTVHVPSSGDEASDVDTIAAALASALGTPARRCRPVATSVRDAYGAQAAADRVDDVYRRLRARTGRAEHRG